MYISHVAGEMMSVLFCIIQIQNKYAGEQGVTTPQLVCERRKDLETSSCPSLDASSSPLAVFLQVHTRLSHLAEMHGLVFVWGKEQENLLNWAYFNRGRSCTPQCTMLINPSELLDYSLVLCSVTHKTINVCKNQNNYLNF